MKKLLFAAGALIAATSAAWAQGYAYGSPHGNPYGYGLGVYEPGPWPGIYAYAGEPFVAPAGAYGAGPYGTGYSWDYYRASGPGRGNNLESTR